RLKRQKLSFFQDYKDSLMTREDYITKKMLIDETVRNLEEQLKEVNTFQLLSNDRLTKEIVSTHIEKVVVDCLGFFTVIYK
ncbi:TPA: recombinase, partial [Streptococcus suis]|nr:recombinase [Streptococcus suis]